MTSIELYTFSRCSSLTTIILPESLTRIGEWAFGECSNLTSIYCLGMNPPTLIGQCVFDSDAYNFADVFVPQGAQDTYQRATGWENFWSIKEFDPSGIDQFTNDNSQMTIYDLNGRKVLDADKIKSGIYIINGKKVFIK